VWITLARAFTSKSRHDHNRAPLILDVVRDNYRRPDTRLFRTNCRIEIYPIDLAAPRKTSVPQKSVALVVRKVLKANLGVGLC
jgi:hypothetical protein